MNLDNFDSIPELKLKTYTYNFLGLQFGVILNTEFIKPFESFIQKINNEVSEVIWENSKLIFANECVSKRSGLPPSYTMTPDWIIRNVLGLSDIFNKMEEVYKSQCLIDDRNNKIGDIIKD